MKTKPLTVEHLTPLARRMLPLAQWAMGELASALMIVSPHAAATRIDVLNNREAERLYERLSELGFVLFSVGNEPGSPNSGAGLFIWLDRAPETKAPPPIDEAFPEPDRSSDCEYEGCDADANVTLDDGTCMCTHHALVAIAHGLPLSEVNAALREADRYYAEPEPSPICHAVGCELKPSAHIPGHGWYCREHAAVVLQGMPREEHAPCAL